ncbi:uncharacterized protein LOC132275114 [Cornus florida]|uniref:uncharacterized protein LOC132275114 n=1 Tax=Cornus florida TaxID=4283 RepID=UPI00289B4B48|nr:uncharacterized protein LOC132275114 [Cornus florida]
MGEALFELEQILRSKQGNLTSQESIVLMTCKANALKDFTIGAGAGAGIVWLATRRLSNLLRINLSGGAAAFSGLWRFGKSLDSCVEHILALDGSQMQKELANIILKKYRNDPRTMQLVSKHFYSEKVFDDSSSDQPKLRWRYRNFFGDNVVHSQQTHDDDSYNDKTDSVKNDVEKTSLEHKQHLTNQSVDAMANPFDCVLGLPGRVEEIPHATTSTASPKRHGRSHKKAHRRRRMRHQEVSSDSEHA